MKKYAIRYVLLGILIFCAFMLQNNLQRYVPYFQITPNLLLIVTFSVGFQRGKGQGMITGLLCGLMLDAFSGGILGYNVLIYVYIGYFNGMLARILVNDMILLPITLCAVNEICYGLYCFAVNVLLIGKTNFQSYMKTILIPELILTVLCTVFLYGIILAVNRRLDSSEKKGERRLVK